MVKPFVEVSFGSERKRTATSHGPYPHWNEEIVIPFQSVNYISLTQYTIIDSYTYTHSPQQGDFSPTALQRITNELRFDLYDETTLDLLQVN